MNIKSDNKMTTSIQNIKIGTLSEMTVKAFMNGSIKSQDDLVTVARIWMTDLEIGFKEALEYINKIQVQISAFQDAILKG